MLNVVQTIPVATQYFPANRPLLPEWTRFSWASLNEQSWWVPLIRQSGTMWHEIERWSVVYGVRKAAWVPCPLDELGAWQRWAMEHGLVLLPFEPLDLRKPYAAGPSWTPGGHTSHYRVLITRPSDIPSLETIASDSAELGTVLGYPTCCREFFARTWLNGQVDTTYDYMMNAGTSFPATTNILWRWLGVRWVPHLPCSPSCQESSDLAMQFKEIGRKLGYHEAVHVTDEILNWPVRWSAINGIAEIVGPCVKISTRTDWSPEQRKFERSGIYHKPEPTLWKDNGFANPDAMRAAHTPILTALTDNLHANARISDLGCGNGYLLKQLKLRRPDIVIGGIDANANIIARAKTDLSSAWKVGSISDTSLWSAWNPTAALISPKRLLEVSEQEAEAIRAVLDTIPQLFVYVYSDFAPYKSLTEMCRAAKFRTPAIISSTADIQIGVLNKRS
jgi:hypothetical protein